jgi:cytochrome P450
VFGHAAVRQFNRDWETFSARGGPTVSRGHEGSAGILSVDPPEHHRLRQIVSSAFTPRMIGLLEERIDKRVDSLLDEVDGEECNFVDSFAYPLPMHAIADIIGIPEADRGFVFSRTKDVLNGLDPEFEPDPEADPDQVSPDLFTYAMELSERKRAHPEDDVWSKIIESGLPAAELDVFFLILSIAGSETTRNALSHGFLALLSEPDKLAPIAADPDLMGRTGTDEILRYTSPVLLFGRDVTVDVDDFGAHIPKGGRVLLWYPVANRDPEAFEDPETFNLHRAPNPHVAFGGGGPHFCLGANLAKREITSAMNRLAERFPHTELSGTPKWSGPGPISNVGCSIEDLPVKLRS